MGDDLDRQATEAVAEMNAAFADYEQARAETERHKREALLSLRWFPKTLLIDGKVRVTRRYIRRKHTEFKAKGDAAGFVNYVATLVATNLVAIEEALGGQQVEPRYMAYLILHAYDRNKRLGS